MSSARAVRCRLKCHNERNPYLQLLTGHAEDSGETVYRIDTIVGEASDLGVENLAGSGLIAGETSRAYKDIMHVLVSCSIW